MRVLPGAPRTHPSRRRAIARSPPASNHPLRAVWKPVTTLGDKGAGYHPDVIVTFFLHGEPDLERLEALDPDRDPGEFRTGERAWILQTCLRLRDAGHPVRLSAEWPGEGIVVFSSKQRRVLRAIARSRDPVVLVACREDVG